MTEAESSKFAELRNDDDTTADDEEVTKQCDMHLTEKALELIPIHLIVQIL